MNCAQAVLKAFKDKCPTDQTMAKMGGGRAPEGVCGAYYAANHLLEKCHPEKVEEFKQEFKNFAGSLKCREIKRIHKTPCADCIAKAAEFLTKLTGTS